MIWLIPFLIPKAVGGYFLYKKYKSAKATVKMANILITPTPNQPK